MRNAALVITSLIAACAFAAVASANKPAGARCWTTPSQVALGGSYSLSASGLPTNAPLNLIILYPNGNTLTTPATSADGAYSLQSTAGGTLDAAQAGTYTFKFVGKVSWPMGTWNKEYATCSMQAGY
jgi:hypothetical protein